MNTKTALLRIGALLMVVSGALLFGYLFFHDLIIRSAELYLSSDHQLTPNGKRLLISTYFFGAVLLFGSGLVLNKAQNVSWRNKIRQVFLEDPLSFHNSAEWSPRLILTISSLVGLFLIVSMQLGYRFPAIYPFFYAKDHGLFDLLVSISMVVSATLILTVVWKLWNTTKFTKNRLFLLVSYLFLAGSFVFYAGEETSWGQDFFQWQTPALFSGNVENQTNIHNYFNAYFDYGYVALSLVLVIVLVSAWLEFNRHWLPYNRLILPHPSLIGLSLLITFVAIVWYHEEELLEEMVAAFIIFYSFRIFRLVRFGNWLTN